MPSIVPHYPFPLPPSGRICAWLARRRLLRVRGAEAEHFLNALFTCDCTALDTEQIRPAALLSPQGKILFDFLITAEQKGPEQKGAEQSFLIDIDAALAEAFTRRLSLYKLRAQAELELLAEGAVFVEAQFPPQQVRGAEKPHEAALGEQLYARRDASFIGLPVFRRYYSGAAELEQAAGKSGAEWERLRIACAVPQSGMDFALNDSFPHDVNYDALGAVSFAKGCYIGQEVVSRMKHKATLRKRLLRVSAADELPAAGAEITAEGKQIGRLGTVCGREGLALVRTDRLPAKDAEPAKADGIALSFHPPHYLPEP